MIYKNLGNTDLRISAIGLGASHVGSYATYDHGVIVERIKGWRLGVELGINFLDTAELYGGGLSEEAVGKAIRDIRERVILATKFNPPPSDTYSKTLAAAESCLRRLGTHYIDLYQIHFPNPLVSIELVMSALVKLIKDGKVRYAGVSNFNTDEMDRAQSCFPIQIVSNQVEYNLVERSAESDILPYCQGKGITLIAYSPLGQGRLSLGAESLAVLQEMAGKYQKSVFQIALRWLISKPSVITVTKAGNTRHIRENVEAVMFLHEPGGPVHS